MTQTARSIAQILALTADNSSQQISPEDLRDAIVTLQIKYGGLFVAAGDTAATVISNTTDFVPLAGTYTLDANGLNFDQSDGNGLLTYTGAPDIVVLISAQASVIAASGTQVCKIRFDKNGAAVTGSVAETVVLSTGAVNAVNHTLVQVSTGDSFGLAIRNTTAAVNITGNEVHFLAIGFAI